MNHTDQTFAYFVYGATVYRGPLLHRAPKSHKPFAALSEQLDRLFFLRTNYNKRGSSTSKVEARLYSGIS